jgi:hypothetical protein
MASYNTIPDLESEPLVAAPPRKYGKASLAVVAALAFGAGALAPSAAARVGLTKFDEIVEVDTSGALSKENKYADIIAVGGTTPAQEPAQEPAGNPIINYSAGAAKAGTDTFVGGESLSTQEADYSATVQGDANANGAAPDTTGQI